MGATEEGATEEGSDMYEYLTLEGKKHKITAQDEYQLLANMEITVADIAQQKLFQFQPLETIKIYGGLVRLANNCKRCFKLTMNFTTSSQSY